MKNMIKYISSVALLLAFSTAFCKTYDIEVTGPMFPNKQFRHNLHVISAATSADTIIIHINSPGGSVGEYLDYGKALKSSGAHTVSYVKNYELAVSAAGMLALITDETLMQPHAIFMAHQATADGVPDNAMTQYMLSDCCSRVLSTRDIAYILANNQVWLNGAEVMRRLRVGQSTNVSTQSNMKLIPTKCATVSGVTTCKRS